MAMFGLKTWGIDPYPKPKTVTTKVSHRLNNDLNIDRKQANHY